MYSTAEECQRFLAFQRPLEDMRSLPKCPQELKGMKKEDPRRSFLGSALVRESPFSGSIQDHNPACTESHALVPGVDAIHKRPPSTLQLVQLLA